MKTATRDITCEHYQPKDEDRHCAHYAGSGKCDRGQGSVCVEWQMANTPWSEEDERPLGCDLFGEPMLSSDLKKPRRASRPQPRPLQPQACPTPAAVPYHGAAVVRNLTEENISSFKALHTEVCLQTEDLGPVWLVPEYTGQCRTELSVEHLATLSALSSVFPGARVVALIRRNSVNTNTTLTEEVPTA